VSRNKVSQHFNCAKGARNFAFDPDLVQPPLTDEILSVFRQGSVLVARTADEIEAKGLLIESIEGADFLPERLRLAHLEIRPGLGMNRNDFKHALTELE